MPKPMPFLSRWGLLTTTLVMGAALIAAGIAGYAAARDAASALVDSRSAEVAFSVRRELHRAGAPADSAALQAVLADLADLGIRSIAVVDPDGAIVASAGAPLDPARHQLRVRAPLESRWAGDRVQLIAAAGPPGRGMGMGPGMMGGRRRGLGGDVDGFVVEYEFPAAHSLIARSLMTLVLVCAAAGLLLGAAAVSFRRSREAERLTEQLARDQQLKSLGQMSAVLSHELRNPLTSLKGHAQLLLEKLRADDAARPDAERMLEGALRLESVANQILDFARHDALPLRPEDPSSVAQAAIEQVGDPRARLSVDPGVGTWNLNRPRLEQLLTNLIRNAADASPPDAPIEVAVASEGRNLVFGVRDHGPGLPPGEEARVFEPFFTRSVRGTGLGLAIAKQIAEAHGGRIEGRTHPEGGALFRVILPHGEPTS